MEIMLDAIVKKTVYDPGGVVQYDGGGTGQKDPSTKITMFDTVLGEDISLKFPEDITLKPGTPVQISGQFHVKLFQSATYLSGVKGQYSIKVSGKIVYDKA